MTLFHVGDSRGFVRSSDDALAPADGHNLTIPQPRLLRDRAHGGLLVPREGELAESCTEDVLPRIAAPLGASSAPHASSRGDGPCHTSTHVELRTQDWRFRVSERRKNEVPRRDPASIQQNANREMGRVQVIPSASGSEEGKDDLTTAELWSSRRSPQARGRVPRGNGGLGHDCTGDRCDPFGCGR